MTAKKKQTVKTTKKKTSGRKKSASTTAFLSLMKKGTIGTMMVVLAVIAVVYVFDRYNPHTPKPSVEQEQQTSLPAKQEKKSVTASSDNAKSDKNKQTKQPAPQLSFPKDAEIPRLLVKRKEQEIRYTGHTLSYNVEYKVSNWVAWELTDKESKSTANERSNKFVPDPTLKGQTALNEDYSRTGYDKGHMLPAGDVKWSAKAMRESFYYSNICPQDPGLNRGIWKNLEEQCRLWAKEYGSLMIITGPVIEDDLKRLGKNRIAIPRRFYKVIATVADNTYQGIAFIMENKDYKQISLKEVTIPIDSVEVVTGIDFFPTLPKQLENKMEATINWAYWTF